jgi:predicted 3-demethylubiquinone-9 3-methyltransferase (glyoxalase superfamily)
LKDQYGLSWQIVPSMLGELLTDVDQEKAQRAVAALLGMKKLDIEALRNA